jgi:hypothetical protein
MELNVAELDAGAALNVWACSPLCHFLTSVCLANLLPSKAIESFGVCFT